MEYFAEQIERAERDLIGVGVGMQDEGGVEAVLALRFQENMEKGSANRSTFLGFFGPLFQFLTPEFFIILE